MKRQVLAAVAAFSLLGGCTSGSRPDGKGGTAGPAGGGPGKSEAMTAGSTVATVNGQPITMKELQQPLIEAYGMNVLLNIVQLKLAQQQAVRAAAIVSPEDIRREREETISKMFREGNQKLEDELDDAVAKKDEKRAAALRDEIQRNNRGLLAQFLRQQGVSEADFNILMETNANLRKVAEPGLKEKITEESLQQAFRVEYGEKVVVRHIECSNPEEIARARAELAAGVPFEKVAMKLSRNARTRDMGGLIEPFSRQQPGLSQEFIDVAFSLKKGQVSEDTVQERGAYHILKCEEFIEPKAVKFEYVKEPLREKLYDRMVQFRIAQLRQEIGQLALDTLRIEEPTLRKQYAERLEKRQGELKTREEINRELEKERARAATLPAIRWPATTRSTTSGGPYDEGPGMMMPRRGPATAPATGANERPPATMPVVPLVPPATHP